MKQFFFLILMLFVFYSQGALASLSIQFWQASSGARVYFVENHDLPILDVSVEFAAGSSMDISTQSGCASLVQQLLSLGAGGFSEDQIATALADVGAQTRSHFDRDRAGIVLRTLSSERERKQALDVFARIIQFPEFPQAILSREKARTISSIKESSTKPDYIAERELMKMLYGNHPYGFNEQGEIETLSKLQREDLLAFYRAHYVAEGAVIAIIGDVTRLEAAAIAEKLTEGLPSAGQSRDVQPVAIPVAETKRLPHPAAQSHIQLAYPGLRRNDPDYFPLLVGNHILGGGGFVSRLMEEVRQQRGLAYSVYSFFAPYKEQGPFQIGLQTKKEQSEEALALTQKVLKDFVLNGPTEKELVAAKQNIIGGFPLRIDSNSKILSFLSVIGFYQLPLTYLTDYLVAVEAVTAEQIRQAFQRRIQPDGMVAVIAGAIE
ncbi:M16 family metallopeptidase [Nitrosomonas ureae]|uniref:Zinc protease n=1 Tax=Nitrosomonas ureae TaxID=44577 RepID=A0A1H8ZIJ8_9PROT|nr:pitrilysin family protein [Nitrosomonas ureae]PTQ87478.1 zinc protease [Nitrosomonas ureae]SDT87480.1 zinc protease [Nitrosomonas ureae]SEP64250.1 zinc protease [Nitrosomonas ureae]